MNKWPVAGILAGIGVFVWGAITHMALGIEQKSISTFSDEAAVTAVLKEKVAQPGFYFFPNEQDPEKMAARVKTSPRGVLLYTPAGVPFSFPASLGTQFVLDILSGVILAWIFSVAIGDPKRKICGPCLGAVVGLFSVAAILLPWWNWYGLPVSMVASGVIEQGVGFGIAGWILGKLIK